MKFSTENLFKLAIATVIVMTLVIFQNCSGGLSSAISGSSTVNSYVDPGNVTPQETAGSHNLSISFAGITRSYVMHVPPGYRDSDRLPLMVVFHPNGGTGSGMENITQFDALSDVNRFLVAYPESNPNDPTNNWATTGVNSDVDFSLAMISAIEGAYSVDPGEIYIAGYSKGGGMVQQLACINTRLFAGAAVIAENFSLPDKKKCAPSKPIPFIFFHGTSDPISPYDGGISSYNGGTTISALETAQYWADANGCKTGPSSTQLPDELSDGTSVQNTKQAWSNCTNAANVTFYTIQSGGHTWPGGTQKVGTKLGAISTELNASAVIWAAFKTDRST